MLRTFMATLLGLFLLTGAPVLAADQGTPDEAKVMAEKAAEAMKSMGKDKAFAAYQDPKGGFVDRDLYVFVIDDTGTVVSHGANEKLIGKSLIKVKDVNGVAFIEEMVKLAKSSGTGWVNYSWPHPVSKKIAPKTSYVVAVDGLAIGVGAYK